MNLSPYTLSLLEDIERRIDPEVEDDLYDQWKKFGNGEITTPVFDPTRKKVSPIGVEIKKININDALGDIELMLDRELADVASRLSGKNKALGIRANYGTGILSSLFGAPIFEMPRNTDTLPTTRPFEDSDKLREIAENGVPDLYAGFGANVFAFGEYCAEIFKKYPKIQKYLRIYHPDTQGPLDITDLMWGSKIFYEMYDDPDLVHSVLRTVTDTYKAFMERWFAIIPNEHELSTHWALMFKGNILLRLDSAVNISVDFYNEFSKPYDRELFDHFGGGCMHFCGKGDHFIESLCEIDSLTGFNLSQPHLNDMDTILRAAQTNQKRIISLKDASNYAKDIGNHGSFITSVCRF